MHHADTLPDVKPGPGGDPIAAREGGSVPRQPAPPIDAETAATILDGSADGGFVSCSGAAVSLLGSVPAMIQIPSAGTGFTPVPALPLTSGEIAAAASGHRLAISRGHRRPDGSEIHLAGFLSRLPGTTSKLLLSLREAGADKLLADRRAALDRLGGEMAGAKDTVEVLELAAECLRRCCGVAEAGYDLLEGDAFYSPEKRPSNRAWPDRSNPVARAQAAVLRRVVERKWVSIPDVREDARTREFAEALGLAGVRSMLNQRCNLLDGYHGIVYLYHPEPTVHDRATADFIAAVGDRVEATMARLAERRLQDASKAEIAHRLQTFASMAKAIVIYGLKDAEAPLVTAVLGRLEALGRAHGDLLKGEGTAAPLMKVADGALGALHGRERFRLRGPEVWLGPQGHPPDGSHAPRVRNERFEVREPFHAGRECLGGLAARDRRRTQDARAGMDRGRGTARP